MGCLLLLLLMGAGDIELNPGPKKRDSCYDLSLCHWNLNNIAAHNFSKLTLLKTYNMKHNFDIICLSETCLHSSIQHDDERLHLNGYKLARADNHNSNKRCAVGIYFKEFLATRQVELYNSNECIVFEVCIQNKKKVILDREITVTIWQLV